MIKVLFVCHGNICRSVMAEYMMRYFVQEQGIGTQFQIDSAAATTEEIGNEMYPPAKRKLEEKGIPYGNHRARLVSPADYNLYDYIIGMDDENMHDMNRIFTNDPDGKLHMMMSFAGQRDKGDKEDKKDKKDKYKSVSDPWYTRDFETTYQDLYSGIQGLISNALKE